MHWSLKFSGLQHDQNLRLGKKICMHICWIWPYAPLCRALIWRDKWLLFFYFFPRGAGMSPLKTLLTCATVLLGMFCRWFSSLLFRCFFLFSLSLTLLCISICFTLCQAAMNSGSRCICLLNTCCRHYQSLTPDRPVSVRHVWEKSTSVECHNII